MAENSRTVENFLKTLITLYGRIVSASSGTSLETNLVTLLSYSSKDSDLEAWISCVDNMWPWQ